MNGLTLAYLGDAYYELKIRNYLVSKGLTDVNQLHKQAIKFTSGVAQAKFIEYFILNQVLNENEINTFKRGRNASGQGRKNIDAKTYQSATGFEALIGQLFLQDKTRADQLINICIDLVDRGEI
ncbi:MAG: Mini-ribonuclease 3 [Acholeplasmataceae bacterium]